MAMEPSLVTSQFCSIANKEQERDVVIYEGEELEKAKLSNKDLINVDKNSSDRSRNIIPGYQKFKLNNKQERKVKENFIPVGNKNSLVETTSNGHSFKRQFPRKGFRSLNFTDQLNIELNGMDITQYRPNGKANNQSSLKNEKSLIMNEEKTTSLNEFQLSDEDASLLQICLRDKVIIRVPDTLDFYCSPCKTKISGTIGQHLRGKKHAHCCLHEVVKNPASSPHSLIYDIPEIIIDAAVSGQVIGINSTTYHCNICKKILNGIKPLAHHLKSHQVESKSPLMNVFCMANRNKSSPESNDVKLRNGMLLVFEYSDSSSEVASSPIVEVSDLFTNMGYMVEHFKNLSKSETMEELHNFAISEVLEQIDCFVCIFCAPGNGNMFFTNSGEAIEFSDIICSFNEAKHPLLQNKPKIFIADIYSNNLVNRVMDSSQSRSLSLSDSTENAITVPKNTISIVASTLRNKSVLLSRLIKNLNILPNLELHALYLQLCLDFEPNIGRVEYHNYQAKKFSFI